MTKTLLSGLLALTVTNNCFAQRLPSVDVPTAVKNALMQKFPRATGVTWEKEKGNFEANWGGRSKEDNSVLFSPLGQFIELVTAIPVNHLPPAVANYVKGHYPGAKISEAGEVTDAAGKMSFEAEVKGRGLRFDQAGQFIKQD